MITSAVINMDDPIIKLNFLKCLSSDINLFRILPRNNHVLAVGIPTTTNIKSIIKRLIIGVSPTSMNAAAMAMATIIAFGFAHCKRTPS